MWITVFAEGSALLIWHICHSAYEIDISLIKHARHKARIHPCSHIQYLHAGRVSANKHLRIHKDVFCVYIHSCVCVGHRAHAQKTYKNVCVHSIYWSTQEWKCSRNITFLMFVPPFLFVRVRMSLTNARINCLPITELEFKARSGDMSELSRCANSLLHYCTIPTCIFTS